MAFPEITPSDRQFDPGFEYIAQKEWRLGGSTRRHYGEEIQAATLSLEFQNIDDAIADAIVVEYETLGQVVPLTLPDALLAGMSAIAVAQVRSLESWFFQDAPQVRSIQPGVSTVSLTLEAEALQAPDLGGTGTPPEPDPPVCEVP